MVCPSCGTAASDGMKFCARCGATLTPPAAAFPQGIPTVGPHGSGPTGGSGEWPQAGGSGGWVQPGGGTGSGDWPQAPSGGWIQPGGGTGSGEHAQPSGGWVQPGGAAGSGDWPQQGSGAWVQPGGGLGSGEHPRTQLGFQPAAAQGDWAQQQQAPQKRSALPIVLALVALVALGVGGLFFFRHYQRMQVLKALIAVETRWNEANLKGDRKALDEVLSDNYHHEENDGKGGKRTVNKKEVLETAAASPGTKRWELTETRLVDWTNDRAVLSGSYATFGDDWEKRSTFVDTFELRNGRWQALSSEVTRIEKK